MTEQEMDSTDAMAYEVDLEAFLQAVDSLEDDYPIELGTVRPLLKELLELRAEKERFSEWWKAVPS